MKLYLFALSSLLTPISYAQSKPAPDAATLYQSAETHYKLQQYKESLGEFQASYELSREPAILFNIGQCYRQLGQLSDARRAFQSFLRDAPTHPRRAVAEQLIKEIDEALALQSEKGGLKISAKQDSAEVFLDGVYQGKSPLTLPNLDPKEHTITIKKEGFADYELSTTVRSAQTTEINVPQLVPLGLSWPAKPYLASSAALTGVGLLGFGAFELFSIQAKKIQSDGIAQPDEQALITKKDKLSTISGVAAITFTVSAAGVLLLGFIKR